MGGRCWQHEGLLDPYLRLAWLDLRQAHLAQRLREQWLGKGIQVRDLAKYALEQLGGLLLAQ
ncbi:hypothetical protein ACLUS7_17815 [Enterobacterales bacterium BD_CKDN230030183-1A_HGKHYDSX7]